MENIAKTTITKASESRIKDVDFFNLGFGKVITDHIFVVDYINGIWINPKIEPFGPFTVSPTTLAFHYGQTVFEGMKAFRMKNGKISIFRIDDHHKRFNTSLKRMCMPEVPFELFYESLVKLVATDEAWLKPIDGNSLYLRPFMIATEERYGVKISDNYKYMVFAGAVGEYYNKPLRVKIEDKYIRASKGGTGFAKCGGNYGGAFYPTRLAQQQGFDQVLWTDGSAELNIEESGTMNVMFVIDGVLTTPALSDSILSGITRDSFLKIAIHLGIKVEERKISANELITKFKSEKIQEAFGTGTAAVTAPIASINIKGENFTLPEYNEESIIKKISQQLLGIRLGLIPDIFNWNTTI
jgi:branched-chain amino acid aminotransferase